MPMRGLLLALLLLAAAGCYSSTDRPDAGPSDTDALEVDPADADPPDDCSPIRGYLVDPATPCVDFSTEVFMGCFDNPSIALAVASCLVERDTGVIVYRWDVPMELERQGWDMIECPGFSYPPPECE